MADKYIAYLDILGFRSLVESNKLSDVKNAYNTFLQKGFDLGIKKFNDVIEVTKMVPLKSVAISDSIIVWTENPTRLSFISIMAAIDGLLTMGFYYGLCLRGSLVAGELETFNPPENLKHYKMAIQPIILGKGLISAIELEKKQLWSGCIVSKDVISLARFQTSAIVSDFLLDAIIKEVTVPYNVPMKEKEERLCKEYHCITWLAARINIDPDQKREFITRKVREAFGKYGKAIDRPDVQEKIDNTVAFIEFLSNR